MSNNILNLINYLYPSRTKDTDFKIATISQASIKGSLENYSEFKGKDLYELIFHITPNNEIYCDLYSHDWVVSKADGEHTNWTTERLDEGPFMFKLHSHLQSLAMSKLQKEIEDNIEKEIRLLIRQRLFNVEIGNHS